MIQISDGIFVGNSADGCNHSLLDHTDIKAVLNVAHDLQGMLGWNDNIEYMQVGIIDGPGNEIVDYCAAVLCLRVLVRRNKSVLVYAHNVSRALVIAMMYINLVGGQKRPNPVAWSYWPSWNECLESVCERTGKDVPVVHSAHITAFDCMPWGLIEVL